MSTTLELLILGLMSVLLVLQVHRTTGASGEISLEDVTSGKVKVNPKKYVQYVTSKPILTMSSADIQFDGDVYYANDEMTWDWNDSHQQPSRKPALYLADPFINIQHAPGQFQPMF